MNTRNVHPRKAQRDFLASKEGNVKDSTRRCYEAVTRNFLEYIESNGIEACEEIDGYVIEQWKIKRKQEDNVSPVTLHNNTKHLRVFIRYLESSELVETGLPDKIDIPNLSDEEARSDEKVNPEQMEGILGYLEIYEYATRLHASTKLLWHTGCRAGALTGLDLQDYDPQQGILKFRNRKETDTPLKNRNTSERNVTLSQDVMDVLNDYINARRVDVTDEYGREPLFTTEHGRLSRQRLYKNFVAVTRPCVYDNNCPHGREVENCDAGMRKKESYLCPSSDSLHPIRRGSITYHLNRDWPTEKVSERCDVSVPVLEKHYDARTHEDKRQGRSQFVDKL